ncbi:MAG: hypothetical protein CVT86_03150 [Alphaproteobacteria bacterium HGW-Alphaproteobacteria-8]|nr:MAG: hypothetical protein CVT86_03150 [Alphaproteobacteria bacterium HGW-Alphaproteobacteria-8]
MGSALELIVVACLLSAPDTCESHRVRLTVQGGDPQLCVYASVREVAYWQQLHGKWRVKSWRCAMTSDDEVI